MKPPSNLRSISDQELHQKTRDVARREQAATLALLQHLAEVSRRKLYARRGFGSLWEYTVKALGYSDSQTAERIRAMEFMSRDQTTREAVVEGRIGVSQASLIERHLRVEEKKTRKPMAKQEVVNVVARVEGKSKRATERELITRWPQPLVREMVKARTPEHTEVRFMIDEDTRQNLARYQELTGRLSMAEVLGACLTFYLEKRDPLRKANVGKDSRENREKSGEAEKGRPNGGGMLTIPVTEPCVVLSADPNGVASKHQERSRYIPVKIRREVRSRSGEQCEYVDPLTGRRCESRYLLQVDHIRAYAKGGSSELENLRMLCAVHNRFLAEEEFGRNKVGGGGGGYGQRCSPQ